MARQHKQWLEPCGQDSSYHKLLWSGVIFYASIKALQATSEPGSLGAIKINYEVQIYEN